MIAGTTGKKVKASAAGVVTEIAKNEETGVLKLHPLVLAMTNQHFHQNFLHLIQTVDLIKPLQNFLSFIFRH